MIDPTGLQLPPPTDWPAFERQMRRLFAEVLGDPNTLMTGRMGQGQGGVDIIGRRLKGHGGYVGIQCKLKDELAATTRLGRRTLLEELEKAAALDPPSLAEFILVTTASDDADLQACARELTQRNAAEGRPSVHVFGWHHLRSLIGEHPSLLADYLPRGTDERVAEDVAAIRAEQGRMADLLRDTLASRETTDPKAGGADATIGRAIDRANAKVGGPHTRDALDELLDLEREEWAAAGDHVRFRLLTAIAVARWELGEQEEAARLIEAAAEIEPETERALANLVAAHLANGRADRAVAAGTRLLELHPTAEGGLAALVQAHEEVSPSPDPLAFLPEGLKGAKEALIGAANVLRRRGDTAWHDVARRASAEHPDDALLARMVAESVLERLAAKDGAHIGSRAEGMPTFAEIDGAAAVLTAQWREHVAMRPLVTDFSLATNAAQMLRMLDREDEAIDILRDANGREGAPPEVATLLGVLLGGTGDQQGALEAMLSLPRTPATAVVLAQIAQGRPELVLQVLAETDWSDATPYEAMWRETLDWEAAKQLGDLAATPEALAGIVVRYPRCLPPRIRQIRESPAADRPGLVAAALAVVDESTPFGEVMHLGQLLRAEELWPQLLELMRDRVTLERDSEGLRWMIEALSEVDDREGLVAVFDVMSSAVADLDRYLRYRVAVFFNVGDLPAARLAADRLVARHPDDLPRRMEWLQVVLRQDDREALSAWLAGPVEDLRGEPGMRADLALLLANNGLDARARSLAYSLARQHPGERHVQERFLGVMIASGREKDSLLSFVRVAPDAVFVAADEHGRARTFRIETEADLPREAIDLLPDSPVAQAAAGLTAGESYKLPPSIAGAAAATFQIREVKHKHLHLMHETMATLNERFPESRMFRAVNIDFTSGTGMDVLLAQVTGRARQVERAFANYHATGIPLRMLPMVLGGDVIDAYDGLRESDARFLATAGDPVRRRREVAVLRRARRGGALVDALTLELIRRFEMLDVVTAVLGDLSTTQSAIDVFSQRVTEMEAMPGRIAGTLTQQDGRLARIDVAPIQADMVLAVRREALAWVGSTATVRPAAGPKGLAARLAAALEGDVGDHLLDDVLAAAQAGIPLLTEDLGYREVAQSEGIPAVGLHAVIEHAVAKKVVDPARRIQLLARMGRAGHEFIPISAAELEEALGADGQTVGPTLKGLLRSLGGGEADLVSHFAVATEFVEATWARPSIISHRLELGKAVADRLLAGHLELREALVARLFADPDDWPRALRTASARANAHALGRA
ncbi:MAG TPA: hypothetical protein VEA61_11130 [Allosphingosinicella sp.]|nr:hypothetical protein [Allosphingosinicella sp.]